ncbi:cyclic nucleotide-binding domain-containing protein [Sulfurimonas sp. SAG-AH-194-C21]|nr:cyclic nucleotide-binding domain-containing protein [Sulfurimonas sp. SAG-AH-194-C21]MDF1883232.1 cyclic nucleotide-binding domain-containing protein [Sulfurimonas sp. SAG-AH-194-C21]
MHTLFINILKVITSIIFASLVPILFLYDFGTTLVWTILIPLLPIGLIIIGFSKWRDICPLALVSKISQRINLFKKRKVPVWFENNFWYFQYGLLFIALSLRLTTLNYDNKLLAIFFIGVILSAFFINLFFTGKSWCNFFCPLGVVEKIYTLSNAKNYNHDSKCGTCTACKVHCPDIDLETNYWKEGAIQQKNFVFYSFPGMILGFYLYFYLLSGSFEYYFLGTWTQDNLSLLYPGFFFAPFIPLFIAAPLSLAIFTTLSFYMFKSIERYLWKKRTFKDINYETLVHRVKTIASFIAFNVFYIFAGAPAYMHYPLVYGVFYFFVVSLSSIILYKEIFRQEAYYIQERFALKFINNWDSIKAIPSNLKEIYYTYINDNRPKKERLKMYKESITELMQEGVLNESSMKILSKLKEQIGITDLEHKRVIKEIKQKNADLFDETIEKSAEKLFQENSYKTLIENALNDRLEIDETHLKSLQLQFNISDTLHHKIMLTLVNENDTIETDILKLLDSIETLIILQKSIFEDGTREILFLKYCIKNEFLYTSKELFSMLFTIYKDNHKVLKSLLNISKEKENDEDFIMDENTLSFLDATIAQKMLFIHKEFRFSSLKSDINLNTSMIKKLLLHDSLQIVTAALLNTKDDTDMYLTQNVLKRFDTVHDIEIRTLLYRLIYQTQEITTYERMMYLNHISIFNNLKLDDLYSLGKSTKVLRYKAGEYIIKQGGLGNTLYILIRGSAITEIDGIKIKTLSHRDYFGEVELLGGTKRTASVKVTLDTVLLAITKKEFKQFLERNPQVSSKVIKGIIKKLI